MPAYAAATISKVPRLALTLKGRSLCWVDAALAGAPPPPRQNELRRLPPLRGQLLLVLSPGCLSMCVRVVVAENCGADGGFRVNVPTGWSELTVRWETVPSQAAQAPPAFQQLVRLRICMRVRTDRVFRLQGVGERRPLVWSAGLARLPLATSQVGLGPRRVGLGLNLKRETSNPIIGPGSKSEVSGSAVWLRLAALSARSSLILRAAAAAAAVTSGASEKLLGAGEGVGNQPLPRLVTVGGPG
eukprot:1512803-Rhodomonas_salina.1